MKILVISNFYPPYSFGGYETLCRDIVNNLKFRGYEIQILTSYFGVCSVRNIIESSFRSASGGQIRDSYPASGTPSYPASQGNYGIKKDCSEDNIHRVLSYRFKAPESPVSLKETIKRDIGDTLYLKRIISDFNPDLLYVFDMAGLSKSLLLTMGELDIPVVYHFSGGWLIFNWIIDNWLAYWKYNNPENKILIFIKQKILGLLNKEPIKEYGKRIMSVNNEDVNIKYAYFVSAFVREQHSQYNAFYNKFPVIYDGIETKRFIREREMSRSSSMKLLYVGRIASYKGVHTAVYAVAKLIQMKYNVSLSIAGPIIDKEYAEELHKVVSEQNLPVKFLGQVDYKSIQDVYFQHDTLIFPSICDEVFPRTVLEAMASGLLVVATGTGGSKEVLKDGENCLLFKPDNPEDLVEKIELLIKNPDVVEKFSKNGAKFVKEHFDVEIMGNKIEKYLKKVVTDGN
ncbi:MAG: glycosyltransferase family 4 protein [bacterium]|nr:glycosyltransferase family 4 protein [bacterium]